MKKVIICVLSCIIVTGCSLYYKKAKTEDIIQTKKMPILSHEKYKDFNIENVKSLNILRYTEAGLNEEKVTDSNTIKSNYNAISKVKILNETKSACEDNTTIYQFIMKDDTKVSFEFECEWIVIDNIRYEIEK